MYAIVKVGGKQYRVETGDSLVVDRMAEDEGAKVLCSRFCSPATTRSSTATGSRR